VSDPGVATYRSFAPDPAVIPRVDDTVNP
jgi:hypothetical protein